MLASTAVGEHAHETTETRTTIPELGPQEGARKKPSHSTKKSLGAVELNSYFGVRRI